MELFIPIIILLISILSGRIINEKSYKLLTVEKKSDLIDVFSNFRIYGFVFIILLIAMLFLFPYFNILNNFYTTIIYIFGIVIYFISMSTVSYKKLKSNDYPARFIKLYIISMLIRFAGLSLFLFYFFIMDIHFDKF